MKATVLLLSVTLMGCDGSNETAGAGGGGAGAGGASGGAGSSPCTGELVVAGASEALRCERGAYALGHGMYRLDLEGTSGAELQITFASVETGTYGVQDCASSTLALAGSIYNSAVDKRDLRIELARDGETLTGNLRGEHCTLLGANPGDDSLTYRCITVELPSFSVPREVDIADDCEPPEDSEGSCNVGVAIAGSCSYLTCRAGAAVCDVE